MSAWHNQAVATRDNGFSGLGARLDFNTLLMMQHAAMLESWLKSGYFTYLGRHDRAEQRFAEGRCAMLTASSSDILRLQHDAKFNFGVAPLPYYKDDFPDAPQNTLVRGGALWVMAGSSYRDYLGVARLFVFLMRPQAQAAWQRYTGYLPMTFEASCLNEKARFYARYSGEQVAADQLLEKPTRNSIGIRPRPLREVNAVINRELDTVWAGKKTLMDALDQAVVGGNRLLRGFQLAHEGGRRRVRMSAVAERSIKADRGRKLARQLQRRYFMAWR